MIEYRKSIALQKQITDERWPQGELWQVRRQLEATSGYKQIKNLRQVVAALSEGKFVSRFSVQNLHKVSELLSQQNGSSQPTPSIQLFQLGGAFWLHGQWHSEQLPVISEFLTKQGGTSVSLRHGFLSSEGDILETFALGFDGLLLCVEGKDPTELQYLIEICRDLKMLLVLVCACQQSLQLALDSDATNIGILCDPGVVPVAVASHMLKQIPGSCLKCAVSHTSQVNNISALLALGFDVVL